MKGTWPLLIAITLVWALVWLGTQSLPTSPLPTAPTVAIGLISTLVVVWGYPSVIRGPRRRSGLSAAAIEAATGDSVTLNGRTMTQLRDGLTDDAIAQSVQLVREVTGATTAQITDTERVLGVANTEFAAMPVVETDRKPAPSSIGPASVAAIEQGAAATRRSGNGTDEEVVAAAPIQVDDLIVGTLCVTYPDPASADLDKLDAIARLLSLYLEISDAPQQAQLAADARLDALRAQINPHFLFNTLNTIASKSRTDADEARQLLQRLADFFRYATQQTGHHAEFAHEYFFVRTYLSLEQARFSERLDVQYDIDPQVLPARVPVLVLQPLVENAVKHGLAPKPKGGTVTLKARVDPLAGSIRISVRDNGVGIDPELLADVAAGTYRSTNGGVGVRNIHERLDQLYGQRYQFDIRSSPGKGTRIELELPL